VTPDNQGEAIVSDKHSEIRERYLTGWRARMNHREADDKQRETSERHVGTGIALGAGFGVAIGAGLGAAFGNLALGIGLGICLGTALGIVLGSIVGKKHTKAMQESSDTDGSRNI
jgi:F0F1-type ATP synthase assembly protein I